MNSGYEVSIGIEFVKLLLLYVCSASVQMLGFLRRLAQQLLLQGSAFVPIPAALGGNRSPKKVLDVRLFCRWAVRCLHSVVYACSWLLHEVICLFSPGV